MYNSLFLFLTHRAYVILKPEFAFPLSYYLIPFTGVVGMVIIVMCIILVSMHNVVHVVQVWQPTVSTRQDSLGKWYQGMLRIEILIFFFKTLETNKHEIGGREI